MLGRLAPRILIASLVLAVLGRSPLGAQVADAEEAAANVAAPESAPTLALYLHMSWSKPQAALERIIPAAAELGYRAIVLEVGGNVQLDAQPGAGAMWTKGEVRELVALAQANGLEVIPCVSLLSHPECAPREPRFVDPSLGVKLWEPGVYHFIERYVAEVCALFGRPRYFHARLDEAGPALAENSNRLGWTAAKVLGDHIRRLDWIVKRQGARLIAYHDMLLPAEAVPIGTALGGEPLNSWKAVDAIPGDVVINFWLYGFLPQHAPAVEFFTHRKLEVWVSPWLAPEPMCRWAADRGMPVVETTWCDPSNLAYYEANLRGVVTAATYRLQPGLADPRELPFDPLLRGVRALMGPAPVPRGAVDQLEFAGPMRDRPVPERSALPATVQLGTERLNVKPVVFRRRHEDVDTRLTRARLPLKVVRGDGVEHRIDGVNRARGEAEVVLYTPAFGTHTGTNMFGGEVVITDGLATDVAGDAWGTGDYVIPPGGCVLSGHCAGDVPAFMAGFRGYDPVRIVDAEGSALLPEAGSDTTLLPGARAAGAAGRTVTEMWIVHATLAEMAKQRLVGVVEMRTTEGTERFEVRFRRDVASSRVARWLVDERGEPARHVSLAWADDRGYGNVRCLWATRLTLSKPQRLLTVRVRPTEAGAAAGWVIAALAAA